MNTPEKEKITTTEYLQKIKSECERLLAFSEKVTVSNYFTCQGRCEAGWRSTIAAIDSCIADDPRYQTMYELANENMIKEIYAAWPIELLQ